MKKSIRETWPARYVLLWIMIALIFVGMICNENFLQPANITSMLISRVTVGIIAVAMTFCMAAGELDISLGYMFGTCVMISAYAAKSGASPALALAIAVIAGFGFGAMNGFFVVVVKIPSTIVTLASGMIMYAITMAISDNKSITGALPSETTTIFKTPVLGLIPSVWIMFALFIVFFFILEHTPFGKQLYCVGFSPRVSYLAGIDSNLMKFLSFMICGGITGVAAMLNIGQTGNAYTSTGPNYLMPCLAVVFLSITTHLIGRYNIVGSLIALLALGFAYSIAGLLGAPFWFENVANGALLLGVVLLNGAESRQALSG